MKSNWELVAKEDKVNTAEETQRQQVPGGWMYRVNHYTLSESGERTLVATAPPRRRS